MVASCSETVVSIQTVIQIWVLQSQSHMHVHQLARLPECVSTVMWYTSTHFFSTSKVVTRTSVQWTYKVQYQYSVGSYDQSDKPVPYHALCCIESHPH